MSKTWGKVSIAIGLLLLFAGALDIRQGLGIWAAFSIMLGLFLVLFGASYASTGPGQKSTRRVSFAFLGAAVILLGIALASFLS
jgi:hypothetical protein